MYNPFGPMRYVHPRRTGIITFGGGGGGSASTIAQVLPDPNAPPAATGTVFNPAGQTYTPAEAAPELKPVVDYSREQIQEAQKKATALERQLASFGQVQEVKEDPGTFQWVWNEVSGGYQRAVYKNSKTGETRYGTWLRGSNTSDTKSKVNQEAQKALPLLNKGQEDYKRYQQYTSVKSQYEDANKSFQQMASDYATKQQQLMQQGQQDLVSGAMTDPSSILQQAQVGQIDTTGTEIAAGTGQVTGAAPTTTAATAGLASQATSAPKTGAALARAATVTPAAERALRQTTAAQGEVSPEAQVTAAQGQLSAEAMAKAAGFDDQYVQEVQAGTRKVSQNELVQYARANNIPESQAAQMLRPYLDVEAAKFAGETPQVQAQDVYSLTPTQIAQQTATKVQDAAQASEIPTAEAATTQFRSTVQAAQGRVGSNELVNAKDIVGAERAVTAVAATMETLNKDAVAVAATGSFSQAAFAKLEQGTVPPEATVQGQMSSLMEQFNDGTPAWAAGAMRAANAAMAARGLGGSSMAGAAIVQATMEAAVPIASQDAQAFQQMNLANLNNRQQVSLANAAAQQNIELANLNNRQQAALQNSANSFSLQSQNLSNQQAVVLANAQLKSALQNKVIDVKTQTALANAARFAEMNNINLNNQQQANLQRSAENLQVNLANLSNQQQTAISNLQVRAALVGQELSNEQQMAVLQSTQEFERAQFDASSKQQAFLQDAQARAALEGRAMDIRQQTALFNVSSVLEDRRLELTNEQQTRIFNSTNRVNIDLAELSNRQQTALANAQIEAALRGQELNNRQQAAVLNAERFAEAANLTFTAEQNAQLHNSELMKTIGLAEMSAANTAALQNAAQLASMDMANLNNRQQAAVQNAQAFLQMDMTNLSNEQQTVMFKAQARQQALFSDQAAENAARQFNASSVNQTNQFFANLQTQTSQFNASQRNAIQQFNAGQENAMRQFNADMINERQKFNAQNSLVIAQANAQWRQSVATTEFAAQHEANMMAAKDANAITTEALDQIWQRERDLMDFAFTSSENVQDRALSITLQKMAADATINAAQYQADVQDNIAKGRLASTIFTKLIFG